MCLLFSNSIVWGDVRLESTTLSPEFRTAMGKFREEFETKYFLLAHDAVNEYIHGQIQKEANGDFSKMDQYEDEVIISDNRCIGILIVSIKGLFEKTGQFAHVGFGSHENNQRHKPIIYIDSEAYYNEGKLQPAKQIILMHEKNEINQWLNKARELDIPLSELRTSWVKNNIDKAKKDANLFHATANSNYNIEQFFNQYSYMLDWAAIYKASQKHGLDSNDKKDINVAAFFMNTGKDLISDNDNMRIAIEIILIYLGKIGLNQKNFIRSRLKTYMDIVRAQNLPGIRIIDGEKEWFFDKNWIRKNESNINLQEKDRYKFVSIADLAGLALPCGKLIELPTDVDMAVKGLEVLQKTLNSFPKKTLQKIENDRSLFQDLLCVFLGVSPERQLIIGCSKNRGFTKTEIKIIKRAIKNNNNFLLIDNGYKPSSFKKALVSEPNVFFNSHIIDILDSDNKTLGTISGTKYIQMVKESSAKTREMFMKTLNDGIFRSQVINVDAATRVMREHPGYFPKEARANPKTWLKNNRSEWDHINNSKNPGRKKHIRYGLLSGFSLNASEKFVDNADENFLEQIGPTLKERLTEEEIKYIDVEYRSELTYEKLWRIIKIFKEKAGDLLTDKMIGSLIIALRGELEGCDSLYDSGWIKFDDGDQMWQQKLDEIFIEAVKRAYTKGTFNYSIETINTWLSEKTLLGKASPEICLKIIKRNKLFEEAIDREKGITPEKMLTLYPENPTAAEPYILSALYKKFELLVDWGVFVRNRKGHYCFSDIMLDQGRCNVFTKSLINAVCDIKYKIGMGDEEKILNRGDIPQEKKPVVKELIKMTIFNQIGIDQEPVIPKNKILWHIVESSLLSETQKMSSFIQKVNNASKKSKSFERIWLLKDGESIGQVIDSIRGICSNAIFDVALSNPDHIDSVPVYNKDNEIKILVFEGKVGDFSQIGGILDALKALHLEEEKVISALLHIYAVINGSCYEGKIPLSSDLKLPREFARNFIFKLPPVTPLPVNDISKMNEKLLKVLIGV